MSAGVVVHGRCSVPSSISRSSILRRIFGVVNACFWQELDDVEWPVCGVEVVVDLV
jgi:hypothetical protein